MTNRAERRAAARPPKDEVEIIDVEQGTYDWRKLHIGVPSASNFGTIMASGKDGGESSTRKKLLNRMAAEILTGEPIDTYKSAAMQRGNDLEPEAREWYARTRFADVQIVGFIKRTIKRQLSFSDLIIGCSPDGLVDDRKILEIKTMETDLMIDLLERGAGGFPGEHRAQAQGMLWVTGRDEVELIIYPSSGISWLNGAPVPTFKLVRDEAYIRQIAEQVEIFDYDLRRLVEKIRAMGNGGKR
jgi:hypothetical protein